MPEDIRDALAVEVRRVTLRDILTTCDAVDIETWALGHAAEIPGLVARVLSALPHWSYCLDIVERFESLLSGGCNPIIHILSADTLQGFERAVFKVLRDASSVEQQSLGLYCLSIMKALLEAGEVRDGAQRWDRSAMMSFFCGSRAAKTVQLAVLHSVWSCSESRAADINEVCETLLVTASVLSAVPLATRLDWCRDNDKILHKLYSKFLAKDVSNEVKFMVRSIVPTLREEFADLPRSYPSFVYLVRLVRAFQVMFLRHARISYLTWDISAFGPLL
ncbi:hypothetical protein ANO11243_084030 [Dothideomycetidae sp. 11243]|nr:hypothetical protein ANO11243_084030 [fungal sp. No.11243]